MIEQGDEVLEKAKQLRAAGVPLAEIEKYVASKRGQPHSANLPDHDAPEIEPTYAQQALGGIASLVRDIPGAEAAQAGVRALVRRQPYREALSDIRGAEESAPAIVRNGNRLIGGGLATAVLPGGAAAKGAQYGALTGALSSDPNSGVTSRAISAGAGAAAGAALGHYGGKVAGKIAPVAGRLRDAAVTRFGLADAVQPAVRMGEASAPKAEGLINNQFDNVLEAVKARGSSGAPSSIVEAVKRNPRQPMFDQFSREAQAADEATHGLPNVVKATERYRTESGRLQQRAPDARFEWFAERQRKTP